MKLLEFIRNKTGLARRKIVKVHSTNPILVNGREVPFSYSLKKGDKVTFSGKTYHFKGEANKKYRYFLFHKPRGYVCSHSDKHNLTIFELLPSYFKSFFIAGRLDKESRGLLILSDDGEFIKYLTHPSNQIEKEYLVKIKGQLKRWQLEKILKGKVLGYRVKAIEKKESNFSEYTIYRIILTEGKKREIREIFRYFSFSVEDLFRIRIDKYLVENLKEGEFTPFHPR